MNPRLLIRASYLGYALMVVAGFGLYVFHNLFSPSRVVIAAQVASVVLMIWSRITLGRRSFHPGADSTVGELVTSGPYRFTRNPIYLSIVVFVTSGVIAHASCRSFAFLILLFAGVSLRIAAEERFLEEQYVGFRAYCRSTKRFFPFLF